MEFNENQIHLLLGFFITDKYNGWNHIAVDLIKKGECVVAGSERIWVGGIGNFISVQQAEGLHRCSIYKFNLDEFIKSGIFKDELFVQKIKAQEAKIKLEKLIQDYNELEKLTK